MNDLPYRPCVGIALFSREGKVFVGERLDSPGAWQMPQGGIDEGETIEQAAFRELKEETGTDKARIIKIHDKKLRYTIPDMVIKKLNLWNGQYAGQEQTWVAMRFEGQDSDIDIAADDHQEFGQWQWVGLEQVVDLIVPFKRDTYRAIIEAFSDITI